MKSLNNLPHSETPNRAAVLLCGMPEMLIRAVAHKYDVASNTGRFDEGTVLPVFGPNIDPEMTKDRILELSTNPRVNALRAIIFTRAIDLNVFQPAIARDLVFYIGRGDPSPDVLETLIEAGWLRGVPYAPPLLTDALSCDEELRGTLATIAASESLAETSANMVKGIEFLLGIGSARLLLYDALSDTLSPTIGCPEDDCEVAATGIAGFALRSKKTTFVEHAAADSRFDPEIDGTDAASVIGAPLIGSAGNGMGVLAISVNRETFERRHAETAAEFVRRVAPLFEASLLREQLKLAAARELRPRHDDLFRREALDEYAREPMEDNIFLPTSHWLLNSHWWVLALLFVGICFLCFAHANESVQGVAIVRARSKSLVIAPAQGTLQSIEVAPGDHVFAGDLIARVRTPPTGTALAEAQAQVTATVNGHVNNIAVRPGDPVQSGDVVATIVDGQRDFEIVAFLTGSAAPKIRDGMTLVVRPRGYPDADISVKVYGAGMEVVGPREALHYAGSAGETLPFTEPQVIVHAALPSNSFLSDGTLLDFRDGMTADVHLIVGRDRILERILPGLKALWKEPK